MYYPPTGGRNAFSIPSLQHICPNDQVRNRWTAHCFGNKTAEVSPKEGRGFAIPSQVSYCAGSQILRFVDLERGPPWEPVEVANEELVEHGYGLEREMPN